MSTLNVPVLMRRGTQADVPASMLAGELYVCLDTGLLFCGTGSGTIEVGGGSAPSGAGNLVYATPNGSSGDALLRALVAADIPSLSSVYDVAGLAATAQSNAESFATSAVATETSRAETAEGLLVPISAITGVPNLVLATNPSGSSSAEAALRALVAADIPTLNQNTSGTAGGLSGTPNISVTNLTVGGTTSFGAGSIAVAALTADTIALTDSTGLFTITGSPATLGSGLTFSAFAAQTANTVLRAGSGTPTFSALVVGDLPTTGTWAFAGTFSGALTFTGNATSTNGTATPGTNPSTAGFEIWQNTTPTVTGASTTLAIKTATAPINVTGNTWRYTFAATESGAGSNAWVGASVTISGYTTTATGNNGTFVIIASTTTTFDVVNATGTTADGGTPVVISSAVVNSPILQIAGTVNTGTAGTLNSVADVWSIQNVLGSVAPNPTSALTFTHSGSGSSVAVVSVPNLALVGAIYYSTEITFYSGTLASNTLEFVMQAAQFRGSSLATIGFSAGAPNAGAADTAISRVSAGVLAIGTGAQGNAAGFLVTSTLSPTSASTAGVTGQWAWDATNLYICTVGGSAGSATWKKVALSSD